MKIAVLSFVVLGLTGWLSPRLASHHVVGGYVVTLDALQVTALALGLSSLVVYLVVSIGNMTRDPRPENRPVATVDPIDMTQCLISEGKKTEAVCFYQEQNRVSLGEAEATIEQIEKSLNAGLRV